MEKAAAPAAWNPQFGVVALFFREEEEGSRMTEPLSATSAEYSKRGDVEVAACFMLMQPIHHCQILPTWINRKNVGWQKIGG
ncbi:hypothetical protein ACE6H2_010956 [Prunus campanulata]